MKNNSDIVNLYLKGLFDQFCKANGLGSNESMSRHSSEFKDWVRVMSSIKNNYVNLLESVDFRSNYLIAELGKGKFDTIVPDLIAKGYDAFMVSPYAKTIGESTEICEGDLVNLSSEVFIKYADSSSQLYMPNCNQAFDTSIGTLVTQLPCLVDMEAFVSTSSKFNDVIIGSYGNTNDKDLKDKVALLRQIREKIESQYCVSCDEELVTENGTYQHLIVSHQKQRVLELVKTRCC